MYRSLAAVVSLLALMSIIGCHSVSRSGGAAVETSGAETKIEAEAYSFNCRMFRDGKPTTFKLELYQTDTLLGMSGRGYLGKGALKGWLTRDSLKVYFPSTDEFIYESLPDLVADSECPLPLARFDVLSLLKTLPDSLESVEGFAVSSDYDDQKKPAFVLESTLADCPWRLELIYDQKNDAWRLRRFEFNDGRSLRLRGERERYKADARVPLKRFDIVIPDDAVRMAP